MKILTRYVPRHNSPLGAETTKTKTRHVPGAVDGIRAALEWSGLEYDYGVWNGLEGLQMHLNVCNRPRDGRPACAVLSSAFLTIRVVFVGLKYYQQSERLDLYQSYAKRLLEVMPPPEFEIQSTDEDSLLFEKSGHAYRCFCSPDTLTETREKLARSGSNLTYDKRCLHLTDEEAARRVRAGEKSTIRLNVPNTFVFLGLKLTLDEQDSILPDRSRTQDIVFGEVRDAHLSLSTDPILLKSDLFPTYHLASVVDDYEMGITHVLRGEVVVHLRCISLR